MMVIDDEAVALMGAIDRVVAADTGADGAGVLGTIALATRDHVGRFAGDLGGLIEHLRNGLTLVRTCAGPGGEVRAICDAVLG